MQVGVGWGVSEAGLHLHVACGGWHACMMMMAGLRAVGTGIHNTRPAGSSSGQPGGAHQGQWMNGGAGEGYSACKDMTVAVFPRLVLVAVLALLTATWL